MYVYSPPYILKQSLLLNPELADVVSLDIQLAPGIFWLRLLSTGIRDGSLFLPSMCVSAGIQTPVLTASTF